MAAKTTLNARNLEALGAARLAELLIELSDGDAGAKRRLRIELAAKVDPRVVGREVRKRINALAKARSFVDWYKTKSLADDLETQRRAIVDQIAKTDCGEAFELIWRFLALAGAIYERCDDSNGMISAIFADACADLGALAAAAKPDRDSLVDQVFAVLQENDYGQYDGLIEVLAPTLEEDGLRNLEVRFHELARQPEEKRSADTERQVVGWSGRGPIYADDVNARRRKSAIESSLKAIADALGDVDAYAAQFSEEAKRSPRIAADLAQRLLTAGRADDALVMLEAVDTDRAAGFYLEWEDAYIETLDVLGRRDAAQELRWQFFCRSLAKSHLKAFLKRLPDFDDVEAEERAIHYVVNYPDFHRSLTFLVSWPALEQAATLILARFREIDGDHYYFLAPAAEKLEGKFPLAATLLRRAMIDFALDTARYKRYKHAAKHLLECESLAPQIEDFAGFETHGEYDTRLKTKHGRKSGFWSHVR